MFRDLFSAPGPQPDDVAAEIASLCHALQIERLANGGATHRPDTTKAQGADHA